MKTPKAPLDIDKWMIDPSPSNQTEVPVLARHLSLLIRELAIEQTSDKLLSASENSTWSWSDYARLGVFICTTCLLMSICVRFWRNHAYLPSCIGSRAAGNIIAILSLGAVGHATWLVYSPLFHERAQWSATVEFLALCKMQQVSIENTLWLSL